MVKSEKNNKSTKSKTIGLVRISTFSKEKNISVDKIFDILEKNNFHVEINPNLKLTGEQIDLINKHLEAEKPSEEIVEDNYSEVIKETFVCDELLSKDTEQENKNEDENYNSNTLFKSFGFIDPLKISSFNHNKKNIAKKNDSSSEKDSKNFKVSKFSNLNKFNNLKKQDGGKPKKFYLDNDLNKENKKNKDNRETEEIKESKWKKEIKENRETKDDRSKQTNDRPNNSSQNFFRSNIIVDSSKSFSEIKNEVKKHKELKIERINRKKEKIENEINAQKKYIKIASSTSLTILSKLLDVDVNELLAKCKGYGVNVSLSEKLDRDTILILAEEYGFFVKFQEDDLRERIKSDFKNTDLKVRIPIVSVMGHVDHGKTTLLDYIRKSNVTKSESGGITQHLGAYKVKTSKGNEIVFLDTPGHEAFNNMRETGCIVSDVVIVIIAADDGVKEQTKEVLSVVKKNNIPIVFAFNKIDREGANVDKVKEKLGSLGFLVEDWGGKYQCQEISAKTGLGVDELLEKVFLEAEILDLKVPFDGPAAGVVIESSLDKGRSYLNNLIVKVGKLKVGDIVVIGTNYCKVKMLINDEGKNIKEALPSTPVKLVGLNTASVPGEKFYVVKTEKEAKDIVLEREEILNKQKLINKKSGDESSERFNFIVKSDVIGTAQAISNSVKGLSSENVIIDVLSYGVGQINENDITLASVSNATIIAFNLKTSGSITQLAKSKLVKIVSFNIIYDILDYISEDIEKVLKKNKPEFYVGKAEIKAVFDISKVGKIAGCVVVEGPVFKDNIVKVVRDGQEVFKGNIKTMKHKKDEINSVKTLDECGICIKNFEDFKVGDFIEFYKIEDDK